MGAKPPLIIVHLLIEWSPYAWLCYKILLTDAEYGTWTKISLGCLAMLWSYFCMLILNQLGLLRLIFRMEYLTG